PSSIFVPQMVVSRTSRATVVIGRPRHAEASCIVRMRSSGMSVLEWLMVFEFWADGSRRGAQDPLNFVTTRTDCRIFSVRLSRIGPISPVALSWLPIIRNNALVPRPGSSSTHFPCRRNLGVGRPSIYTAASGRIYPAEPGKCQQRALPVKLTTTPVQDGIL